jgi:hypothetical protein
MFASAGSLGWGCARFFSCSYSSDLGCTPTCATIVVSPPWQSMQASRTVRVGCIEGSSVDMWQEIQPMFLRSTSTWDWPSKLPCCAAHCEARIRPSNKSNAATAITAAIRKDQTRPERLIRVSDSVASSGISIYARCRCKIKPVKTETAHR